MKLDLPLIGILKEKIRTSRRQGITENGKPAKAIRFRDFMAACLYEPEYGYYSSDKVRVGRSGDFYTSSYIGEAFADCLASRLARLADEHFGSDSEVEVLDWGGGTGRLAGQLLSAWEREGATRWRVSVVDGNPAHRQEAQRGLEQAIEQGKACVLSPEEAEAIEWRERNVILVGNELLDAMPVHRLIRKAGMVREWGVAWDLRAGRFVSCLLEPDEELLLSMERDRIRLREGQTCEIGRDAEEWFAARSSSFGDAIAVFIDYGDESEELSAAHRMNGTLVCYRNHLACDDPYEAPGEQDITAHVNFTGMRRAGKEAGWEELWYGTQLRFLTDSGLLDGLVPLANADPFHPNARRNRAIRQLLLSDRMSELFKVQIFRRTHE
ncbi:class I SAM-dependent methyltransferase [Cohnella sp. AR92]|uniref:class I SAM-dependent methyltransferase n=1 Tax=Cohnella sp. AR92 TaxID=648716 RepID=UPI00131521DF|nr:SAM-dependent methyltransferase [Cohnella sp. AR92]